jgi:hypothetical protein
MVAREEKGLHGRRMSSKENTTLDACPLLDQVAVHFPNRLVTILIIVVLVGMLVEHLTMPQRGRKISFKSLQTWQ